MKVTTYLVGFAAVYIWIPGLPSEKTVRVDRFINCPQYKNLPLYVDGAQFTQNRRIYYINTKIIAKRDIEPNLRLVLKFERCTSRENPDTCEPYQDVNIKDICSLIHQDHKPWSVFVKNLDPPIYCPIKKAVHTCRNATLDGTALSVLPISGFFLKSRALIFEPGSNISMPVMCIYGEYEIVNI